MFSINCKKPHALTGSHEARCSIPLSSTKKLQGRAQAAVPFFMRFSKLNAQSPWVDALSKAQVYVNLSDYYDLGWEGSLNY